MSETVVAVDGVGHVFGDVTVYRDVSFTLDRGEVVALVGPNGSGKTTLLRDVAGLTDPTTGTVERRVEATRDVGYLPQQPAFRPAFTVGETLTFYADLVDADADVADRLAAVGLEAVSDRRVDALSGGMVHLLGLAQATVGDPPLVVLDEPTSGLDPEMSEHMFEVVADVASGGDRTVLFATHDLTAVERIADRILLLDRGGIAARGTPADLEAETDSDSLFEVFSTLVGGGTDEDGEPRAVRAGTRAGGDAR